MYKRNVDLNELFPPGSHDKQPYKGTESISKKDMADEDIIEKVSKEMVGVLEKN